MNFSKFSKPVAEQYNKMAKGELFFVDVQRDELFNMYLAAFPEGTNLIHKTRLEYDCTCCKQFIRNTGHVVSITPNGLETIWDIQTDEPVFQVVADLLADYVKSRNVVGVYRSDVKLIGSPMSRQMLGDGKVITWNHFSYELPHKFIVTNKSVAAFNGNAETNKALLERGLTEISLEACDMVKDLIDQNSLYRGTEHLNTVKLAIRLIKEWQALGDSNSENYLWVKSVELGESCRFKNSVIGTLLVDITSGIDLEDAVKMFESKVAPQNYKRPTALITQGMIKKAEDKIVELGLETALYRRYAITEDITVNNVLFADRSAKKVMTGALDILSASVKANTPSIDKVQEMSIQDFLDNVLPNSTSLELMLENKHSSNLMSLIAPQHKEAGSILKWDNNFSWTYNGEVADSIKERVKAAGGSVTGDLCCRLAWDYKDDLDFHMIEPHGYEISFSNRRKSSHSGGVLDLDANGADGYREDPAENIVYSNRRTMQEGIYTLFVYNYNRRSDGKGFEVEVEFDGVTYSMPFSGTLGQSQKVIVAKIEYSKMNGFSIKDSLPSSHSSKDIWGVSTNTWTKVSMLMNSPNHWDGHATGNKHWFFILEGCQNLSSARGFYNEFLKDSLHEHRKVFEVLGSKLKAEYSENQLSGVGFSSTIPNSVLCRVSGNFNRVIKINF